MNKEVNISTFYNEDHKRRAVISKDQYHYIVRCYEREDLKLTELLENKTLRYAEDLAENFVEGYGAFKIGNLCNKA